MVRFSVAGLKGQWHWSEMARWTLFVAIAVAVVISQLPAAPQASKAFVAKDYDAGKFRICELNWDETTFCTTTVSPIHGTRPRPLNSTACAAHMAISRPAPINPSWIATVRIC